IQNKVQEICGLLQSIRPVRDDKTVKTVSLIQYYIPYLEHIIQGHMGRRFLDRIDFLQSDIEVHSTVQSHRILFSRSEEHTTELQSRFDIVLRLLLEKDTTYYR